MLRLIFVFSIILIGAYFSLTGPFYALLFYLWNAYFRPEFWVWDFDTVAPLRLSLVIGAFLLAASIRSFARFRWSLSLFLALAFFIQSTISLLLSPHQTLIVPFWVEFLKVVLITVLITLLVSDERRYRLTLLTIALSLGFEGAKQGWTSFFRNPGGTNINPNVLLGDNNGVALGMMMLIPMFIALAQTSSTRWERFAHRFFIVGVFYRSISTYSRGGFLAAGAVSLISLARAKHKIRTIIAVGLIGYAIASVMPEAFWERMNTITAPSEERDVSIESRVFYWELAQRVTDDYPFTGVGMNGFRYSFSKYSIASGGEEGQRAAHSVWFGLMADLGYPGLTIFVALMLSSIFTCEKLRRRARRRGHHSIATYASHLQTSIVVFAVGGTFLSAQYLELIWHIFGLVIALDRIEASQAVEVPQGTTRVEAPKTQVFTTPRYVPAASRRA